eukprot:403341689
MAGNQDTLRSLKIAYIFIITLIVYVALIPIYSNRCRKNTIAFGLLNSFAGGVFLTMAFVHILPEAVETYNLQMKTSHSEAQDSDGHRMLKQENFETVTNFNQMLGGGRFLDETEEETHVEEEAHAEIFPLPYVLFFLGYTVILLIDRILSVHFGVNHHHGHGEDENILEDDHTETKKIVVDEEKQQDIKISSVNRTIQPNTIDLDQIWQHKSQGGDEIQQNAVQKSNASEKQDFQENADSVEKSYQSKGLNLKPTGDSAPLQLDMSYEVKGHPSIQQEKSKTQKFNQQDQLQIKQTVRIQNHQKQPSQRESEEDLHHHTFEHSKLPTEKEVIVCGINLTPMVLLIALGFHSVFEGIALGLIKDLGVFINLMIGITIHHTVVSLSYGISLAKAKNKSQTAMLLSIVGLSLFESGGLAIGLGLNDAPEMVSSIILSFAGGTFVYIACSEILVHEFSVIKHRYWKFLCFIIGSAIIICLWFLHAHEE